LNLEIALLREVATQHKLRFARNDEKGAKMTRGERLFVKSKSFLELDND
jgi:hypothetical protein